MTKLDKVSAVHDFGDINKRLREIRSHKDTPPINDPHCVCLGNGWIGVHNGRIWDIVECPICNNPARRKRPG
jgi:hypothetical protein